MKIKPKEQKGESGTQLNFGAKFTRKTTSWPKKGDALALPFGVVTWWYNKEDTELVVLFLVDTSNAHKAGELITNFFLTGSNRIFTGFSNESVGRAWDLCEKYVQTIVGSQLGKGIVKLDVNIKLLEPKPEDRKGMALKDLEAPLDVDTKDGGRVVVLNTKNLPWLVRLDLEQILLD
ncbi:hypothetical protein K1719_032616 [Acacia pycnantha]|nr:hypothetical protein K1719_032616 [Acacia pycnantha]